VLAPVPADAEAVLAVCVARDVADLGRPDVVIEDLLGDWENPAIDRERDCFVVEDGGAIVAYAIADHRGAMMSVPPGSHGRIHGPGGDGLRSPVREAVREPAQVRDPARRSERGHDQTGDRNRQRPPLRCGGAVPGSPPPSTSVDSRRATARGSTLNGSRRYRTCAPKRA